MKLIGAGFGRTGTTSLKGALDQLGLPAYHMTEVFKHPDHVSMWTDAAAGKPVDWDVLLRGYEAAVDWPPAKFYRELMVKYPDAKVLLSVRESDKWYTSTRETIYEIGQAMSGWISRIPRPGRFKTMVEAVVWQGTFQGRFEDRAYAIDVYDRHNETVKRDVPADRLLVWNVRDGWEPLCKFLNVPVPAGPFPHLNDSAEFKRMIARVRFVSWAVPALAAALVLFGVWHFAMR